MGGSFDNGDITTTNLYVGNVNPSVKESDLCDLFVTFGPLASVKIMWPRTDEERARNRNSGFVAYMTRTDAERALKTLNGFKLKGYDMKLGWAKAICIPPTPIAIPDPNRTTDRFSANIEDLNSILSSQKPTDLEEPLKVRGTLSESQLQQLDGMLTTLDTSRKSIGASMLFCINHSDSAEEIIKSISDRFGSDSNFKQTLAKIYLVSDILHNCSARVTNASFYHGGFRSALNYIFTKIRESLIDVNDTHQVDKFKSKVMKILKAWKEWTLYEDDFLISLCDIVLGLDDDPLDGSPIDDKLLTQCLESKGLDPALMEFIGEKRHKRLRIAR